MNIAMTLDLPASTTDAKRKAFYDALTAASFTKISVVTTLWTSTAYATLAGGQAAVKACGVATGVTIQKAYLFDYNSWVALP